jgi:hypothetical protein
MQRLYQGRSITNLAEELDKLREIGIYEIF